MRPKIIRNHHINYVYENVKSLEELLLAQPAYTEEQYRKLRDLRIGLQGAKDCIYQLDQTQADYERASNAANKEK